MLKSYIAIIYGVPKSQLIVLETIFMSPAHNREIVAIYLKITEFLHQIILRLKTVNQNLLCIFLKHPM